MAAVDTSEQAGPAVEEGGVRRRDFINIAAVSFAAASARSRSSIRWSTR